MNEEQQTPPMHQTQSDLIPKKFLFELKLPFNNLSLLSAKITGVIKTVVTLPIFLETLIYLDLSREK